MTALVFLHVNGVEALPSPDDLERATLRVATGEMPKADLTEWFREAAA